MAPEITRKPEFIIIFSMFLGALSIIFGLIPGYVMNHLTKLLEPNSQQSFQEIIPPLVFFFVAVISTGAIDVVKRYLTVLYLEQRSLADLIDLIRGIIRCPEHKQVERDTAKMSNRLLQDVRHRNSLRFRLFTELPILVMAFFSILYVLVFGLDPETPVVGTYLPKEFSQTGNWFLAIAILLIAPVNWLSFLFDKKIQHSQRSILETNDHLSSTVLESLVGAKEIRAFRAFDFVIERVKKAGNEAKKATLSFVKTDSLITGAVPIIEGFFRFFLLALGARLCTGPLDLPIVGITVKEIGWNDYLGFAGTAYLLQSYSAQASALYFDWQVFRSASKRVDEIRRMTPDKADQNAGKTNDDVLVALEDVTLSSGSSGLILNGINLLIQPKENWAIVGPSGCGKSTLLNVLTGDQIPSGGKAAIAGRNPAVDIQSDTKTPIGFVPQRPTIFNASILDNILLSRSSIGGMPLSEAKGLIRRAIDIADLSEFLLKRALELPSDRLKIQKLNVKSLPAVREDIQKILGNKYSIIAPSVTDHGNFPNHSLLENLLSINCRMSLLEDTHQLVQNVRSLISDLPELNSLLTRLHRIYDSTAHNNILDLPVEGLGQLLDSDLSSLVSSQEYLDELDLEIASVKKTIKQLIEDPSRNNYAQFFNKNVRPTTMRELLLGRSLVSTVGSVLEELDSAIYEALQKNNLLDELVDLGLEDSAGVMGGKLSGGQAAKVAIARAIVKEPNLLILDEATAALDEMSQRNILLALIEEFRDSAIINVSHRIETTKLFDQVAVMEGGKIVQRGSFSELEMQEGVFSQLIQNSEYQAIGYDNKHLIANETKDPLRFVVQSLKSSRLLGVLSDEDIRSILRLGRQKFCPNQLTLFKQGEHGDEIFLLIKGRVDLFHTRASDSRTSVVDSLMPGSCFGEIAALGDIPRTLTAIAAADCELLVFDKTEFLHLITRRPEIASQVVSELAKLVGDLRIGGQGRNLYNP